MHKTSTLVSTSGKPTQGKKTLRPADIPEVSDAVVNAILHYSRSLTVKPSASIGFIEMVAS